MALSSDQIAALKDKAEEIAAPLNEWLLADVAERVAGAGKMTSTAAYELYRARALGESKRAIKRYLEEQLKLSKSEIQALFRAAARYSQKNDYERLGKGAPTIEDSFLQVVNGAALLANKDFKNFTQTLGMVDPFGRAKPLQAAYRSAMDFAFSQVFSGAADYNTAVYMATRKMADMGVRVVDYESGVHTGIEAATRRNILGGLGLLDEQITQNTHDALGCDGWEISAHANSAPDHEDIQGKRYTDAEYKALNARLTRRIGTLNCGHVALPIILEASSPQYTKKELSNLKARNQAGIAYEGRHYTGYEATQQQNALERAAQKQQRRITVLEHLGDKDRLLAAKVRLTRIKQEYRKFSAYAKLPTREQRLRAIKI